MTTAKMTYTDGFKSTNATQKAFNDLNPDENSTYQISFTVYELRLRYKMLRMRTSFCSRVSRSSSATGDHSERPAHGVHCVHLCNDTAASTVDGSGLHPAYFRIGEYYQQHINHYYSRDTTYGKLYPMLTNGFTMKEYPNNFKQVQNSNIQMDMDYLMHDIGFSGQEYQVDMWEFLIRPLPTFRVLAPQTLPLAVRMTLLDEDS
ncbi:MAG: hypothetical protein ACLUOF_00350 [Ruminococcus sp.]